MDNQNSLFSSLKSMRQSIRESIRQQRRQLNPQQQQQAADQVTERVLQHPNVQQATTLALFLSFDGELDTQPLIQQLWQQQKQICLPVLHPFSAGNLLFLRYTPQTSLVINRLKIKQPRLDVRDIVPLRSLDVIFTPLVAFDSHGQRLGMGGGFYDRTLQHWQQYGFYPIGLAHDCQQVATLPQQPWDIPLPTILTPSKQWQW